MNKKTKVYLLIAFLWTWSGWLGAYLISSLQDNELSTDYTIFSLWTNVWGSEHFLPQLLFALAVYGPLVGFLLTSTFKKQLDDSDGSKRLWYYILIIPLISALPAIVLSIVASQYSQGGLFPTIIATIILYFISNLLTSGTEEFGWRGFLYPELKALGMSFWDIAWKGGLIWAFWHFPLMFMIYLPKGLAVLIPSLIGFVAAIVAMNYITNFIYEKTRNIWFVAILHALNNTMSFVVLLLFPKTPFTILTSIMAWVFVWWIDQKYKKVFE